RLPLAVHVSWSTIVGEIRTWATRSKRAATVREWECCRGRADRSLTLAARSGRGSAAPGRPHGVAGDKKTPAVRPGFGLVRGYRPDRHREAGRRSLLLPALVARLPFQRVLLLVDDRAEGGLLGVQRREFLP